MLLYANFDFAGEKANRVDEIDGFYAHKGKLLLFKSNDIEKSVKEIVVAYENSWAVYHLGITETEHELRYFCLSD